MPEITNYKKGSEFDNCNIVIPDQQDEHEGRNIIRHIHQFPTSEVEFWNNIDWRILNDLIEHIKV